MLFALFSLWLSACVLDNQTSPQINSNLDTNFSNNMTWYENEKISENIIKLTVNSQIFYIKLEDNPSTLKFRTLLPMDINMTEFNGNEKFFKLDQNLPTDIYTPWDIKEWDFMLWWSDTIVIYYKSFSSPYSFTKLGNISDTEWLKKALGSWNVDVKLELE